MTRSQKTLSTSFLQNVAPVFADTIRARAKDLEAQLAALVARGQTAWPKLSVDPLEWVAYLAQRYKNDPAATDVPSFPHAEDLFLSYACVIGSSQAIGLFEQAHFKNLRTHVAQLSPTPDFLSDIAQTLRQKLFVAEEDKPRGIAAYAGSGPLGAWFRVTALNTALKLLRSEAKHQTSATPPPTPRSQLTPERDLVRARAKENLEETLKRVLSQAPARERALLRMHFVEGLTLEELAQTMDVHRATIVRWIRAARESILEETQKQLAQRLKLSPSEVSSTFRMTRSDWTLSLQSVLTAKEK